MGLPLAQGSSLELSVGVSPSSHEELSVRGSVAVYVWVVDPESIWLISMYNLHRGHRLIYGWVIGESDPMIYQNPKERLTSLKVTQLGGA